MNLMVSNVLFKTKGFRGIHGSIGKSVPCTPSFFVGSFLLKHDKDWANEQLRYGIRLLENDPSCGGGPFSGALICAISIKENLALVGWPWQAERLQNWVNKARAKQGFLDGKYHPKPPLRALKELDSVQEDRGGF
jgi:glutathione S-transferase